MSPQVRPKGEYRSAQHKGNPVNRARRIGSALALSLALLASAGCADRGQQGQPVASRAVQPPWQAAANPFVVPGWTSGDQASWQQQMTKRAQNQNEFLRVN